jgi:peptidoglycan/xylan/chitin deacetylase (PgdA/CDA1 family)
MLSLFTRDDYAALGLTALLDIERIPYQRIRRLADHDRTLLVALGADLSAAESAEIAGQRALVLNGGTAFASHVLGAEQAALDDGPAALRLSEPIWPAAVSGLAGDFGKRALRLPRVAFCRLPGRRRGDLLAELLTDDDSVVLPAVLQIGDCVWSSLDLGVASAHLLTERYAPDVAATTAAPLRAWARGAAEAAYYLAPARLRRALRSGSYRLLERRLQGLGARASEYPVDATGWLLLELVKALIRRTAGCLVRVARWPAGCQSAAVLTHDLEPRRYAYTEGLTRLLGCVERGRLPSAFGVVARAGARHLSGPARADLSAREVFCHGLDHRGEQVVGRARVTHSLRRARTTLEQHLGRPVRGYRSPRLDRSAHLDWALDAVGFTYDSSHPDVDRENLAHYGRGVRLNLPYRPLIEDADGAWRASRCLELPLTAPDCIQPLFAGDDVAQLRATVAEKARFVRASGGCYVALVHAGVFGPDDAARREAHLDFVVAQLRHPETWLTNLAWLVEWWGARERLQVNVVADAVQVVNQGSQALDGAVLLLERGTSTQTAALPALAAGGAISVAWHADADEPGEWSTCSAASR